MEKQSVSRTVSATINQAVSQRSVTTRKVANQINKSLAGRRFDLKGATCRRLKRQNHSCGRVELPEQANSGLAAEGLRAAREAI